MPRKKISTTVYLDKRQAEALAELSVITGVPQAKFIRDGIDVIIEANRDKLAKPEPWAGAVS